MHLRPLSCGQVEEAERQIIQHALEAEGAKAELELLETFAGQLV